MGDLDFGRSDGLFDLGGVAAPEYGVFFRRSSASSRAARLFGERKRVSAVIGVKYEQFELQFEDDVLHLDDFTLALALQRLVAHLQLLQLAVAVAQ